MTTPSVKAAQELDYELFTKQHIDYCRKSVAQSYFDASTSSYILSIIGTSPPTQDEVERWLDALKKHGTPQSDLDELSNSPEEWLKGKNIWG
ncbi:uncharacterized protein PG998_000775 [Apiospora kogelbergensis]|uniref:uncharacterized protein n=1 Tax=Apiospora kogelbergensis TaxID=1337665 RepID=UPI00312FABDD